MHEKKIDPRQRGQGGNDVGFDTEVARRALCGMGFKDAEARRALAMVELRSAGSAPPIETVLREALAALA